MFICLLLIAQSVVKLLLKGNLKNTCWTCSSTQERYSWIAQSVVKVCVIIPVYVSHRRYFTLFSVYREVPLQFAQCINVVFWKKKKQYCCTVHCLYTVSLDILMVIITQLKSSVIHLCFSLIFFPVITKQVCRLMTQLFLLNRKHNRNRNIVHLIANRTFSPNRAALNSGINLPSSRVHKSLFHV